MSGLSASSFLGLPLPLLLLSLFLREVNGSQPRIELVDLLFLRLGLGLGFLLEEFVAHLSVHLHALVLVDWRSLKPALLRCLLLRPLVDR